MQGTHPNARDPVDDISLSPFNLYLASGLRVIKLVFIKTILTQKRSRKLDYYRTHLETGLILEPSKTMWLPQEESIG